MRKALAFLFVLLLLAGLSCVPAAAESTQPYSLDAAMQFCKVWNDYYSRNSLNLYAGYILDGDNTSFKSLCVIYNGDNRQVRYGSGLIPPTSDLFVIYDLASEEFGFRVFSMDMKSDLEAVKIYSGGKTIANFRVSSSHGSQDAWIMSIPRETVQTLLNYSRFTLELTIDGEKHPLLFSRDNYSYFYDMVEWLISAARYTGTGDEQYLSTDLFPEDARPTATPSPTPVPADQPTLSADIPAETPAPISLVLPAYSFREDLDAIDSAAQSVFYIEILDKNKESIGRASGFVAFDEHLFVTNQHVIDEAYYLQVEGEDGSVYLLDKVIVSDKVHDIAILIFPDGDKYAALEMDADSVLKRGQPVVTIGNPIGYRGTVAYGNISAFPTMEDYGDLKCIQFTAPTSHGSSGGCLFNDYGKVIGVTSAIGVSVYTGEVGNDVGLAVPIRVVQELYSQWDKRSFEPLGTRRSWDMVSVTPSPTPKPRSETALSLETMYWEEIDDDKVTLCFDVCNATYGIPVESFELYLYATDSTGSRIYGSDYEFNRTTVRAVDPGRTIQSDKFVLPRWSQVSRVYCKISRVKLSDGTTVTLDMKYDCYVVR